MKHCTARSFELLHKETILLLQQISFPLLGLHPTVATETKEEKRNGRGKNRRMGHPGLIVQHSAKNQDVKKESGQKRNPAQKIKPGRHITFFEPNEGHWNSNQYAHERTGHQNYKEERIQRRPQGTEGSQGLKPDGRKNDPIQPLPLPGL